METRLFFSFYQDSHRTRQSELEICTVKNMSAGFDVIHIICETEADLSRLNTVLSGVMNMPMTMVVRKVLGRRPTVSDFFEAMRTYPDRGLNVFCNTDIAILSANDFEKFFIKKDNECVALALSRWDVQQDGSHVLFDRADSQDTWAFFGHPRFRPAYDYKMGTAGIDNRMAYDMEQAGYTVLNPARTIKTLHLHLSGIRNYVDGNGNVTERVPPPYKFVQPY